MGYPGVPNYPLIPMTVDTFGFLVGLMIVMIAIFTAFAFAVIVKDFYGCYTSEEEEAEEQLNQPAS